MLGCFGECLDTGPPPDSILSLPPPPIPSFLQYPYLDLILNSTSCSSVQLCESWLLSNRVPDSGDYVELPRKDVETWTETGIDDTWLLVLVASSIGVLLLGALLAMFLLKCREMNIFKENEYSIHTQNHRQNIKNPESRECSAVVNGNKLGHHPSETVMFHSNNQNIPDNRAVWAALTPRGTQHFISETFPRDLIDYGEDHYETIDNLEVQPTLLPHLPAYGGYQKGLPIKLVREKSSFDNSGFVDYDYEDPSSLLESYQLSDVENREPNHYSSLLRNTDMRCVSFANNSGTFKNGMTTIRPRVSAPTHIEHPNLPPLNLYPHKSNTLKMNTLNYRHIDAGTLPKYGC